MFRLYDPKRKQFVSVACYGSRERAERALVRYRIRTIEGSRKDLGQRAFDWIVIEVDEC